MFDRVSNSAVGIVFLLFEGDQLKMVDRDCLCTGAVGHGSKRICIKFTYNVDLHKSYKEKWKSNENIHSWMRQYVFIWCKENDKQIWAQNSITFKSIKHQWP